MEKDNQNNEIDLLALFSNIAKSVKKGLINLLIALYVFVKIYMYYLAAAFLIGVGYTYLTSGSGDEAVTKVEAVFQSSLNNRNVVSKIVSKYNSHLRDGAYTHLSKRTGLTEDYLSNFSSVKLFSEVQNLEEIEYYKEYIKESKSKEEDILAKVEKRHLYTISFVVTKQTGDEDYYSQLIYGVEKYFMTNKYVLDQFQIKTNELKEKITVFEEQIAELKKFQEKVLENDKMRAVRVVEGQMIVSPQLTYEDKIIKLNEKLAQCRLEFKQYQPISMLTDFSVVHESRAVQVFKFGFMLLMLMAGLAFFIEIVKWLKKLQESPKK